MTRMSRVLSALTIGVAMAVPAPALAEDPAPPTCSYGGWGQWTNSADDPLVLHDKAYVDVMCSDASQQPLEFEVVEQGTLGQLSFEAGGFARYTPNVPLPMTGEPDSVRFRAFPPGHPERVSPIYTVYLKIGRDQNRAPTCTIFDPPSSGLGVPDDALLLATCSDPDVDPVTFSAAPGAAPQQGELVFSQYGVGYRRYAGTSAADTFSVVATDPFGARATVTLTVAAGPAPEGAPAPPAPPAAGAVITARRLTSLLSAPKASRTDLDRVLRTGTLPGPAMLPDADGRATLVARAADRTLGTRSIRLNKGRRVALDVRLTRSGRRALRRANRSVRVSLGVAVRDATGATRRTTYRLRLRR